MSVAVAEQFRGDRVAVGLVVAQDAAERGASLRLRVLRSDRMSASSSQSWGRRDDVLLSGSNVLLSYYPDEGPKGGDFDDRIVKDEPRSGEPATEEARIQTF